MSQQDKKIRKNLLKKDKDFSEQLKEQMQAQQKMLQGYFQDYQKPVSQDPTIMKREAGIDRKAVLEQALTPIRIFGLFYTDFWMMKCHTPEEQYTLDLCKNNVKKQTAIGLTGSLALIGLISYKNKMRMSPKLHFVSLLIGIASGVLYGIVNSTKFTLQQFEKLGSDYGLGRISKTQIQRFRMDSKI